MDVDVGGVTYHLERQGRGTPLVVLHGFTGSAAAMRDVIDPLAEDHDVIAVDLPGHGTTAAPDLTRYGGPAVARDLAMLLAHLGVSTATWFGYSMGGRYALHVALHAPRAVGALVLLGASPGIADDAERARRRSDDDAAAATLERDGLDAFLDRWEHLPLFASLQQLPPERRAHIRAWRSRNTAAGLAASLRGFGPGTMQPLNARLGEIEAPVLALAGARDERYAAVAANVAAAVPRGRSAVIASAGHAAHLERPADVVAAIRSACGAP